MTDDATDLTIRRAIGGDPTATSWIVEHGHTSDDAIVIAMAALIQRDARLLDRAQTVAATRRDRQVVAITSAYLEGKVELVDALARDHLADYPDGLIVAWIASSQATMRGANRGRAD